MHYWKRRGQFNIATSRQLAFQAINYLDTQEDLSALLGVEAWRTAETYEAKNALLSRLQQALGQTIQEYGRPIPGGLTDINCVAVSPDEEHLAWGTGDGKVVLWNINDQVGENTFDGHQDAVLGLAFSPDGRTLASGSGDQTIILWDLVEGTSTVLYDVTHVRSVSFHPGGDLLAAAVGTQVSIWDLNQNSVIEKLRFHTENLRSVAWSVDGSMIASGGEDWRVIVWDTETWMPILSHRTHKDTVNSVAWSPNGRLLVSGSEDGSIIFWDVIDGRAVMDPLIVNGGDPVYAVSINRSGDILAFGGGDRILHLVDLESFKEIGRLENYHERALSSLQFSPTMGRNLLLSGSFDNSVGFHLILPQQPLNEQIFAVDGGILSLGFNQQKSQVVDYLEGEIRVLEFTA